ncbi:MAG: methyltransferase domain-containing protein [Rhizomicrobium sp.]
MERPADYSARVQAKYNAVADIYSDEDRWHAYMLTRVKRAIERFSALLNNPDVVIDIGSGGIRQNVSCSRYIQVDFAFDRLVGQPLAVCADAHKLPLADGCADAVICVGAVASYCSLVELVIEMARVAAHGAPMLLHVELSNTFELLFSPKYRSDAAFVSTFYKGDEQLWMYSRKNVLRTLKAAGFEIVASDYSHIASALAYKITRNSNFSAKFSWLDRPLTLIPGIGEFADNGFFFCRKSA